MTTHAYRVEEWKAVTIRDLSSTLALPTARLPMLTVKLGTLLMQSYVSPQSKFDVTSLTSAVGSWHR